MANQVALEIFYDGVWHDLVTTDQVLAEQDIVITRGSGAGEVGGFRPTTVTARLNNNDDMLRPSNPESPLYGAVRQGVPVRVSNRGSVRSVGEAQAFRSGQSRDFRAQPRRGSAWVDLEAAGPLQRINAWAETLRSPMYRHTVRIPNLAGYWPLEDPRGTEYAFTPIPRAWSSLVTNLGFESQYRPPGSDPLADVDAGPTSTEGYFAPGPAAGTAGWQISWAQKVTEFDPAETYTLMFWRTSGRVDWSLISSGGNLILLGNDGGSISVNVVSGGFDLAEAGWMLWCVEAAYSGGTTNLRVTAWSHSREIYAAIFTGSYAGIPGSLGRWWVSGMTITDMTVGHVTGINADRTVQDLLSFTRLSVFGGYDGERAHDRFGRVLGAELGIGLYVFGTTSTRMGPQQSGTLPDFLTQLANTDDALVIDQRNENKISLLGRSWRYNQTPFVIDVTELPIPPPDATDDVGVWNVARLTQPDGATYEARDSTGPMGTAPPPAGIGERQQPPLDVNHAADIDQHTNWWLRRGTVDLPRYPVLTVNLAALSPARAAVLAELDVGKVIELRGYRENPIRLHVLGYAEVIGWPNRWTMAFTCAPDQQFHVRTYDEARYDLRTATIKVAATATATQLILKTTDDEEWSNTSTYDVFVAGERITFVAGQMGARTGTPGNWQQIVQNVLRSRNGIHKPLPVGAPIHVATPGRYAL